MDSDADKVVPVDIGFHPEAGAPMPVLLQGSGSAFVVFHAIAKSAAGERVERTGIVEIVHCRISKFGYPNDEALGGHPLYRSGLGFYGTFEVLRSSWIRQLADQNRVCFPNSDHSSGRHFIITFHDETFECICEEIRPSLSEDSRQTVIERLCRGL